MSVLIPFAGSCYHASVDSVYMYMPTQCTYLWKSTIIPQIAVIREAIVDVARLSLFHILLNWIKRLPCCNLGKRGGVGGGGTENTSKSTLLHMLCFQVYKLLAR